MRKKSSRREGTDDLRPEYDLAKLGNGVRGKYAERYRKGTNLVLLDPDVAPHFRDPRAVNNALRLLLTIAKKAVG